ncbi:hypothetical protein HJG60_011757 [Phyllostomus discolor]|uniref:Uncharacterized protein n=1 Tax=Phyllostomus discolor TaxID=89673 RepID=A0A834DVV8_9CHIR|nr:hypothetical protein HJG60_011757 [Phyllostomus discolor]
MDRWRGRNGELSGRGCRAPWYGLRSAAPPTSPTVLATQPVPGWRGGEPRGRPRGAKGGVGSPVGLARRLRVFSWWTTAPSAPRPPARAASLKHKPPPACPPEVPQPVPTSEEQAPPGVPAPLSRLPRCPAVRSKRSRLVAVAEHQPSRSEGPRSLAGFLGVQGGRTSRGPGRAGCQRPARPSTQGWPVGRPDCRRQPQWGQQTAPSGTKLCQTAPATQRGCLLMITGSFQKVQLRDSQRQGVYRARRGRGVCVCVCAELPRPARCSLSNSLAFFSQNFILSPVT